MQQQAVFLFDIDDTLVPTGYESWLACADLVNVFLISKGFTQPYPTEYLAQHFAGISVDVFLNMQAEQLGFIITPGEMNYVLSTAEQLILEHARQNIGPHAAVQAALSAVQRQGHVLGIVSSSSRSWIEFCLDAANISDFFNPNFIFSARSSEFQAKPHPAIYLEALQKLPKELPVIAVEGSAKGVEAAASAAVPTVIGCVAFCSPEIRFRQAAQLSQLGAEIVFSLWDDFESVTEEVLASFAVAPTPVPSYGLTG